MFMFWLLQVEEVDGLLDPCPLPSMLKKRGLNEKERLLYAPMADVGGLLYDKDAVYIDIPDWKVTVLTDPVTPVACPSVVQRCAFMGQWLSLAMQKLRCLPGSCLHIDVARA